MNEKEKITELTAHSEESSAPVIQVAPSPHFYSSALTTRKMMLDVIIALIPVIMAAVYIFRFHAVKQMAICVVTCLISEWIFVRMRSKPITITDCTAIITGLILGLSLPVIAPWYVGVIGSVVAIGIGKIIFGGLGMNIFNPAMVGRAFVMISFAGVMAASGYVDPDNAIDAITMATPLNAFKQGGEATGIAALFLGTTNGSPGEVSAIACLLGGIYLCIRKTASWEIPAGVISITIILGFISDIAGLQPGWTVLHHLLGGALLFGAFFIATDPVTSPLTPKGKFVFGAGVGFFIMLLRVFSGYPEGVMFAVLLMNGIRPLIDRWLPYKTLGQK
jgi:electron transport complex protein RnfD